MGGRGGLGGGLGVGGWKGFGGRNGIGGRKGNGGRKGIGGRNGNGGRDGNGGRNGRGGKKVSTSDFSSERDGFETLNFWLQKLGFFLGLNEKNPAEKMRSPSFVVMRLTEEEVESTGTSQCGSLLLMSLKVHPLIIFACLLTLNGNFTLNSPYLSVSTSSLKLGVECSTLHSTPTLAPTHDKTKHQSKPQTP